MEPIRIIHFSDVLCVWAYVSQIRYDELMSNFAGRVSIDYRFLIGIRSGSRRLMLAQETVGPLEFRAQTGTSGGCFSGPMSPYSQM